MTNSPCTAGENPARRQRVEPRVERLLRFDIDPAADKEPVWIIVPVRGGRRRGERMIIGHCARRDPGGKAHRGVVIVYVDRVRGYDLRASYGTNSSHDAGPRHDPNGRLMSSRYTASRQQCIDRARRGGCGQSNIATAGAQLVRRVHVASAYDGSVTGAHRATR